MNFDYSCEGSTNLFAIGLRSQVYNWCLAILELPLLFQHSSIKQYRCMQKTVAILIELHTCSPGSCSIVLEVEPPITPVVLKAARGHP